MFAEKLDDNYTDKSAGLCQRRGWHDPQYECYRTKSGYTCLVLVNGREYQTDLPYVTNSLAQENAASAHSWCAETSL